MDAVTFEQLEVAHAAVYRLRVDERLDCGRVWQIIGQNGSGKTSVLEHVLFAQAGRGACIRINNEPISRFALGVLKYGALYEKWRVGQNVSYFVAHKPARLDSLRYARQLIESSWLRRRVYELSNAQQKLLLIGLLLEQEHQVLAIDEFDDAFDDNNKDRVLQVISDWVRDIPGRVAFLAGKRPIPTVRWGVELIAGESSVNHYDARVVEYADQAQRDT